jgi:hypothetical protein
VLQREQPLTQGYQKLSEQWLERKESAP